MGLIKDEKTREVLEDVLHILEVSRSATALAYIRARLGYAISVTVDGIGYPGTEEAERDYKYALMLVNERRAGENDG